MPQSARIEIRQQRAGRCVEEAELGKAVGFVRYRSSPVFKVINIVYCFGSSYDFRASVFY